MICWTHSRKLLGKETRGHALNLSAVKTERIACRHFRVAICSALALIVVAVASLLHSLLILPI